MKKKLILATAASMLLVMTQCEKDNANSECTKSTKCLVSPDAGLCLAAITKYYYSQQEKTCKEFIWGGCGGVVPFETMEDCKQKCDCQ